MAKKTSTPTATSTRSSSRLLGRKAPEETVQKTTKKTAEKKHLKEAAPKEESKDISSPTKNSKKWAVGSIISSIKLKNQNEEEVDLLKQVQDHGIVIFFYPKASTPGCTTQGQLFRDSLQEFTEAGFKVYGCSADSCKSQSNFKTKQNFNYELLSDPSFELIGAVGAKAAGNKITRSHIVITKGGKVGDIKIKISPKDSANQALEFIKSL
jgi:thioredoxin-dependent peroxiredoxin